MKRYSCRNLTSFYLKLALLVLLTVVLFMPVKTAEGACTLATCVAKVQLLPAIGNFPTLRTSDIEVQVAIPATTPVSGIQLRIVFPFVASPDLQISQIIPNPALTSSLSYAVTSSSVSGTNAYVDILALNTGSGYQNNNIYTSFATIRLIPTRAFDNKAVTFDRVVSKMTKKLDASDILGITSGATFTAFGSGPSASPAPSVTPIPTPTASPVPSPSASPANSPFPTASPQTSPSASPINANLTFVIRMENVTTARPDKQVKVEFRQNEVHISTTTLQFTANLNGIYSNSVPMTILNGTYDILIKGPVHLSSRFNNQQFLPGNNFLDYSSSKLLAGDIFGNDKVDIYDYAQLVTDYGPRMPASGSQADLNFDGAVNVTDFGILVNNINKSGAGLIY